ncbi:MAG: site-specific DNA-methyltransferase [Nanoarchaeota archaeon]|nr:site-specific DNA-methyltransferase [Nanoarchaeota archaeon]
MKGEIIYSTRYGKALIGDSLELLPALQDESVNLIMTSPPFGLVRKKEYGNVPADEYVEWFKPFARHFHRILKKNGSLVIDIGGSWIPGKPVKSLYQYELLITLCKEMGFNLAQEFFWYNSAKLPSPAEWVTVRRIRVKDAVNCIWWLSKTENPKSNNKNILVPYSDSMKTLLKKGYKSQLRPSGHDISTNFCRNNNGAIPSNMISLANTESNGKYLKYCKSNNLKPHPARYPCALPEMFIKFLTEKGDLILDPFAGSNATGEAAERLGRKWLAFELNKPYLIASRGRFDKEIQTTIKN